MSFDFSWTNSNQPTGKVFARKRPQVSKSAAVSPKLTKLAPISNTSEVSLVRKPKPTDVNKQVVPTSKISEVSFGRKPKPIDVNKRDGSVDLTPKFVKRKQKKDKLAAKAALQNPDNTDNPVINKPTTSNNTTSHSLFSVRHKNVYVNSNISGKSVVEKVFSADKKFSDLEIHRHLVSNLEKHSFTALTRVQEKSIPSITTGKNVLIRSQTGSGKTLAYAVPIIDALQSINPRIERSAGVQAIVVVPTRELALQVHELFNKINTFQWIVIGHLCGGENRKTEKDRLRKGVHVLIATPGRLLDHILHTAAFKVDNVRCLILDEADRLLDMGFKKDIVKIVEELDRSKSNAEYDPLAMLKGQKPKEEIQEDDGAPLKNPASKSRQTVLLSATLTKGIAELADFTMKDHEYVDSLDDNSNVNPEHMVIPNTVKQEFVVTYVKHKLFTLTSLLLAQSKHKTFVFMATGPMVDYHYELFTKHLVKMPKTRGKLDVLLEDVDLSDSDDEEEVVFDVEFFKLHGSMDQSARKAVFQGFRAAKKGILLCTDVAARGVDVPEADCIIQYTGPQTDDDYLHRVGRTGRAGKSGSAIIFLTHEEQEFIARLQKHKVFLKERKAEEFRRHLCDLMEEPDEEKAATALQNYFEKVVSKNPELHRMACFAYSSWSRFYNTYPATMRSIFDFRNANLGHYVTSFALKETPSGVAKIVRGQVGSVQPRRLNQKLQIHSGDQARKSAPKRKLMNKSLSLSMSEFSSGLAPVKKKKKLKNK